MTLKLEQKGVMQPPPVLPGPAEATSQSIQSWSGVIAATHWDLYRRKQVDGADFYVGEKELGHLHLDGEVHLATSPELGAMLTSNGLARRFAYSGNPYEGWVETSIHTPADAAHATWLFRLNYDRLQGIPLPVLLARIADHGTACAQNGSKEAG